MAKMNSTPCFRIGVTELATKWKIPVSELLRRATVDELAIGIVDYSGAHLRPPPTGVIRPEFAQNPSQFPYIGVLTIDADDLGRIAAENSAIVNHGYLNWLEGRHLVVFDPPRKLTIADLVVPMGEVESQLVQSGKVSAEEFLSERREVTLLKIIGALGLVIAKGKGASGNWGTNPHKDALAKDILGTLNQLTKDQGLILDTYGLSRSNLTAYIAEGIKLLKMH